MGGGWEGHDTSRHTPSTAHLLNGTLLICFGTVSSLFEVIIIEGEVVARKKVGLFLDNFAVKDLKQCIRKVILLENSILTTEESIRNHSVHCIIC